MNNQIEAMKQAEKQAHTDHPMRHWDRTCPACVAEPEQEPVAWVKEGNKRVGFGRIEERKYVQFDQTLPVGTKLYTAPPSKPDLSQEMVEALQQWANGERFGDQEELDNARLSRNVILAKIKEQE